MSAKIIDGVMMIGPYAVACLLFTSTSSFGLDLLGALGWYIATVFLGLAIHMFGVYSLVLYFLSRIHPVEFFRRIIERQAIRRMDDGRLSPQEIERIGLALMRLEETIHELARHFDLAPEELNLDLGPFGRLL